MDWDKLLSLETQSERDKLPKQFNEYPISEVERDYEQIISSSAFRRLQDKTQVFPLDKSDFIRTRLTHSIEVSTIARQLGIMLTKNKKDNGKDDFKNGGEHTDNIPSILSCAGLLHDIGNPPFGHFGEVVIGEWFKNAFNSGKLEFAGIPVQNILNKQMRKDLENFEGNAQALRILTKGYTNRYKMNISYAVINTLIKYPTDSCSFSKENKDIKKHKPGYYYSENEIVKNICELTGTKIENEYVRHPLTYLLEAADDIAYATADLEDAAKKGLFNADQFVKYYSEEIKEVKSKNVLNQNGQPIIQYDERLLELLKDMLKDAKEANKSEFKALQDWIKIVKKWLMYAALYGFTNAYEDIMEGTYKEDVFYGTNNEHTIKILKNAMVKFVFNNSEILKLELAAKKIIESLLDVFVPAVIYWDEPKHKDKFTKADDKYVNLISGNLTDEFKNKKPQGDAERLYLKFLMVTDFISGMTDSYAKGLYQELYGLKQ